MSILYLVLLILSSTSTYILGRNNERIKWININRKLKEHKTKTQCHTKIKQTED